MASEIKTRVYVTVDVECREERRVGRRVLPPAGYDARIWGRFRNQRRDLGIRLIMDELDRYGFASTMYLDPFGSLHFGAEPFREVCDEIRSRGHDLQVHAHPIQREACWITKGVDAPADKMNEYDREGQAAILREALDIFEDAGVPRGMLTSFRAGHFAADTSTWDAMADVGLKVSSSFNPCYVENGTCRIRWTGPDGGLFDTGHGVWELPVSTFRQPGGGRRHLQITAVSLAEMTDCLEQAHALRIPQVTIVTHSFELFHIDDEAEGRGRANTVNVRRLRGLAKYLDRRRDRFEVDTVGALASRLPDERIEPVTRAPEGRKVLFGARQIGQAYKRLEAKLPAIEPLARVVVPLG